MYENKTAYQAPHEVSYQLGLEGLHDSEKYILANFLSPGVSTLEGGTGGGRIALELAQEGFSDITAFDFIPEMVESARAKNRWSSLKFEVQDATKLSYSDTAYGQILYLEQMLSSIVVEEQRQSALRELYRVLDFNGTAVISVLCREGARHRWPQSIIFPLIEYCRLSPDARQRNLTGLFPWIKVSDSLRLGFLWDAPPYAHWCDVEHLWRELERIGFNVTQVLYNPGSQNSSHAADTLEELRKIKGAALIAFFVLKKIS
jgi:SAM-dependent methyltransferase